MKRIFIGLGSNVGDRLEFLRSAVRTLEKSGVITIERCSAVYETEPVGKKNQPYFLNAVLEVSSEESARSLHQRCRLVESALGRTKTERWGPREIDLDLLYYGEEQYESDGLVIPHPETANRRFVLVGLNDLAPDLFDPAVKKTVADMLRECRDMSSVIKSPFSISTE